MNMATSAAAIAAAGAVSPAILTVAEMRKIVQDALLDRGDERYEILHGVEDIPAEEFVQMPTARTPFEPAVAALRAHGVDVPATFGGVMKALMFTQDDMHVVVCGCDKDDRTALTACEAAGWFAFIMGGKED